VHITNKEVRHRTGQPPVTSVIAKRWLSLFGHLARADPSQDHSRILQTGSIVIQRFGNTGQVDRGGHGSVQLNSTSAHSLGLNAAWMRVQDRTKWRRQLVEQLCSLMGGARYSVMMMTQVWWTEIYGLYMTASTALYIASCGKNERKILCHLFDENNNDCSCTE